VYIRAVYFLNINGKVTKRLKMKNKFFMGMAAVMMVAILSGCGKAPQV
jgi:hypothetical protein